MNQKLFRNLLLGDKHLIFAIHTLTSPVRWSLSLVNLSFTEAVCIPSIRFARTFSTFTLVVKGKLMQI